MPTIYYARAIDGLDRGTVLAEGALVGELLRARGLDMVDPVSEWSKNEPSWAGGSGDHSSMVESDLRLLRKSDVVLMDVSISGRSYIGCICELVYSYMWKIPVVVIVGDTGHEARPWLRYHAAHIVAGRQAAIDVVSEILAT